MAAYLVTFLLFILYLIVIPIGISPFETPKVVLTEIAIVVLLFIKITRFKKIDFRHLISPQIIFISILLLLSLDTAVLFKPADAFFGNIFRLQGQFLFYHLLLFSILSKDIRIDKIPQFIYYLSFICLVLGTIILGVNENNRAFATLGEPNSLSATALFIFPFIFFPSKKLPRTFFLIATFAIILLAGSRAGLIGFLIQLIFIALASKMKSGRLSKAVIVSAILICISLVLPFIENVGWFENRSEIWTTSFKAGLTSPLIGHGFGNIQSIIHQTAIDLNNNVRFQIVDSSHNFLLDFWIQGGLVGVVSILILIILSFHGLIKRKKVLELTAFLGIISAMFFNPVSVVILIAFWWLIGQGFAHSST